MSSWSYSTQDAQRDERYDRAERKLLERRRPSRVLAALGRFFIRCLMAEQETRIAACAPAKDEVAFKSLAEKQFARPYDPLFGSDNGVRRK